MKIYIIGSVGSGKSTLARQISKITGIPCHHLDEMVHIDDPTNSWGNRKRCTEERDALFSMILTKDTYIIEDVGRECFVDGMQQADAVILLDIPLLVCKRRILLRWIKQNLGIEKCTYRPCLDMLKSMFKWAKNYDSGKRIESFKDKTIILRSNKDVKRYLASPLRYNN